MYFTVVIAYDLPWVGRRVDKITTFAPNENVAVEQATLMYRTNRYRNIEILDILH